MINEKIIRPASIIVLGGSDDISKPGGKVLQNLLSGSFKGDLYVINPKQQTVQGVPSFPSAAEAPEAELAIIAVAAKHVLPAVKELAGRKGVRAFIIFSAGFSETGEAGAALEREVADIISRHNGCLIGPNCVGVLTPHYNGIFAGPIPKLDPQGCDFVSGSGATAVFIIEKGIPMGLSFASLFSVGNSAQVGVEEVVEYWDNTFDPDTSSKVKLLYLENIRNPRKLIKHSRSLIRKGCRIAAVKAGSSAAGSRAASSHTGALATADNAVEALFRKAGIVRCHGRDDLLITAAIFTHPKMKGKNVAVITHAGGPGVMLTDTLSRGGLAVPHLQGPAADELLKQLYPGSSVGNPIDFLATGNAEQLSTIIDFMETRFDNIDAMAVIFGDPGLFDVKPVYQALDKKMNQCQKPIFPILPSVYSAGEAIEYFKSLGRVYFSDEVAFGRRLTAIAQSPQPALEDRPLPLDKTVVKSVITTAGPGYLQPPEVAALLDAAGIPRVFETVVHSTTELKGALSAIEFPLAMKAVGPIHKSDLGGVLLDIEDQASAVLGFKKLMDLPEARSVLIQPMLGGMELFVGAKKEGEFGHLVLCGLGGIFIEVLEDTAAGLTPLSRQEAQGMIESLKGYKILKGARGRKGINLELFADIICKLSALLEACPEIQELDINPLLADDKGIKAVDARILIQK